MIKSGRKVIREGRQDQEGDEKGLEGGGWFGEKLAEPMVARHNPGGRRKQVEKRKKMGRTWTGCAGVPGGDSGLTSAPESAPFALPITASRLSRPGPAREIPAVIPPFLGLLGLWLTSVSRLLHPYVYGAIRRLKGRFTHVSVGA
jgi:hypothetical protein